MIKIITSCTFNMHSFLSSISSDHNSVHVVMETMLHALMFTAVFIHDKKPWQCLCLLLLSVPVSSVSFLTSNELISAVTVRQTCLHFSSKSPWLVPRPVGDQAEWWDGEEGKRGGERRKRMGKKKKEDEDVRERRRSQETTTSNSLARISAFLSHREETGWSQDSIKTIVTNWFSYFVPRSLLISVVLWTPRVTSPELFIRLSD